MSYDPKLLRVASLAVETMPMLSLEQEVQSIIDAGGPQFDGYLPRPKTFSFGLRRDTPPEPKSKAALKSRANAKAARKARHVTRRALSERSSK